ncbi:MAG: hypothetical protein K2O84_01900 [Oscillospiraceae bacterium]|nr:hypothetical protein [Oscillospiraceae bacterium]
MDMNKEYASKGVAGAGLGTGIAGLSLGVLNSLGGLAGMAGAFAPRNPSGCTAANDVLTATLAAGCMRGALLSCCGDNDPVTQREMTLTQKLAEKDTQIALRDAVTYTDRQNLDMYKYIDGRIQEIKTTLSEQAVQNQANKDSFVLLQQQMASDKAALQKEICCEKEARRCADDIIVNYVNATFYPKMVADVTTGTDTTAQPVSNPLPACNCDCKC